MGKSKDTEKSYAKELYVRGGKTQKQIAVIVGVTEQALSGWIKTENWESEKINVVSSKREQLRTLYTQLGLLNEQNLIALTDEDPLTNPNTDSLIKLTKAIKYLESDLGISDIVETGMQFLEFVAETSTEHLALVTDLFHAFVKSKS